MVEPQLRSSIFESTGMRQPTVSKAAIFGGLTGIPKANTLSSHIPFGQSLLMKFCLLFEFMIADIASTGTLLMMVSGDIKVNLQMTW